MKLSIAITTYNRPRLTIQSFNKILSDDRISEIVIVDDCSTEENYKELRRLVTNLNSDKIIVYRNDINLGMSLNKFTAISRCTNDWIIIFDSDNIIDRSYIDAFERINYQTIDNNSMIFCPSGALPKFDYSSLQGMIIDKSNVGELFKGIYATITEWLLNTCNYIVHKKTYVLNYNHNKEMKATDTIWHNYNHLKNGGSFYVVPNMTYQHLVWEGSGWRENRKYNKEKAVEVKRLIEQL